MRLLKVFIRGELIELQYVQVKRLANVLGVSVRPTRDELKEKLFWGNLSSVKR